MKKTTLRSNIAAAVLMVYGLLYLLGVPGIVLFGAYELWARQVSLETWVQGLMIGIVAEAFLWRIISLILLRGTRRKLLEKDALIYLMTQNMNEASAIVGEIKESVDEVRKNMEEHINEQKIN